MRWPRGSLVAMSSRVGGAALALTAAALLTVSVVTSAWWSGHPQLDNGPAINAKDVAVGLLGAAKGCNTGGDGSCERILLQQAFVVTKYVELGLLGVLVLNTIAVGALSLARSPRRRLFARLTIAAACIAVAGGIAVIAIGPGISSQATVTLPFGYGLYLFFAGVALSIAAAVAAMRQPRAPVQQPAPPTPPDRPSISPPQPVDVLALFRDDPPRPAIQPPFVPPPPPPSQAAFVGAPALIAPKPPIRAKPASNAPPIPPPRPRVPPPPIESARAATDTDPAVALFGDRTSPSVPLVDQELEAIAKVPVSTAPDSLPPPSLAAASGPSPACPQCEAPMAWVEEHLRFYCKSCRMYF